MQHKTLFISHFLKKKKTNKNNPYKQNSYLQTALRPANKNAAYKNNFLSVFKKLIYKKTESKNAHKP